MVIVLEYGSVYVTKKKKILLDCSSMALHLLYIGLGVENINVVYFFSIFLPLSVSTIKTKEK